MVIEMLETHLRGLFSNPQGYWNWGIQTFWGSNKYVEMEYRSIETDNSLVELDLNFKIGR